jgi:hypothetical protein
MQGFIQWGYGGLYPWPEFYMGAGFPPEINLRGVKKYFETRKKFPPKIS